MKYIDRFQVSEEGLHVDMPASEFFKLLHEKTGVPVGRQEILCGFPPKPLQLDDLSASATLSTLQLVSGDSLTVRETSAPPVPPPAAAAVTAPTSSRLANASVPSREAPTMSPQPVAFSQPSPQVPGEDFDDDPELAMAIAASLAESTGNTSGSALPPAQHTGETRASSQHASNGSSKPQHNGPARPQGGNTAALTEVELPDGSCVVRRVIDSDNSCLFNAVGYVMDRNRKAAPALRRVIADKVRSDPFTYNEGFLGKTTEEYCNWIQLSDKWGGAIELSILCHHFAREIAAYDIQTKRCDIYGQDAGYSERVLLLYDGLHYDCMAVAAFKGAPEELDVTIFEPSSSSAKHIEAAAAKLVESCHHARQFTDTASFTLRCNICQIGIKGEKEAVAHAKATGHQNFVEY